MLKRLPIVPVLLALTLSACSGRGAAQTPTSAITDTQPATEIAATIGLPLVTETATAQPSGTSVTGTPATPTSGTVVPTNPPDCTNSASFVADVTIPDNSNIAPGTLFTKTWRIANKGTCTWGPTYKLAYYSEERMGAPDSTAIPITYPGQTADISINLTSPTSTGKHQANFVIKNSAGAIVKVGDDSRLWTVINVTIGGAVPTAAASATATSGASTSSTLAPATLPAATVPAATGSAATAGTATAGVGSANPTPGTASCLYAIDPARLMDVINAVNAYRAQKSLPAYTVNPKLAQAAQLHANDMACNHLFTHNGSDGSTPQTRVAATGYIALDLSENVYGSYPPLSGQDAVNWWANDKTDLRHNANLLSATFIEIGVGYSFFENYGYYVIVFAKPKP